MDTNEHGMACLRNTKTGEVVERHAVDAAEMLAVKDSPWVVAPVGLTVTPGAKPKAGEESASTESVDFDALSKDELIAEAIKQNVTVKRHDGEDGEPLKEDYVSALTKAAKKAAKEA